MTLGVKAAGGKEKNEELLLQIAGGCVTGAVGAVWELAWGPGQLREDGETQTRPSVRGQDCAAGVFLALTIALWLWKRLTFGAAG